MKSLLKLLCSILVPTSILALTILILCQQMPTQATQVIISLNQIFELRLWTEIGQWQVASLIALAISIPLLIFILVNMIIWNSRLKAQKDMHSQGYDEIMTYLRGALAQFVSNQSGLAELHGPELARAIAALLAGTESQEGEVAIIEQAGAAEHARLKDLLSQINVKLESFKDRIAGIKQNNSGLQTQVDELADEKANFARELSGLDPDSIEQAIKDLIDETGTLDERVTELAGLKAKLEQATANLKASQAKLAPYLDKDTGIDAMLDAAQDIKKALVESLDGIEQDDFSQTTEEVEELEDDGNLAERLDQLKDLVERIDDAGKVLAETVTKYQDILDTFAKKKQE